MTTISFDRLLRSSSFASQATSDDAFRRSGSTRGSLADDDCLEGKIGNARGGASSAGKSPSLSRMLDKRTPLIRRFGAAAEKGLAPGTPAFDPRQRVVVKVHYFSHSAGGGGALEAHARYVARDAATRDDLPDDLDRDGTEDREPILERESQERARAHAAYLTRNGQVERSVFYDRETDGVDGAARAETWARSDLRHFRVVLSPDNGARLGDLPAYTREVMARAEAALGTKLQWIAVDHWDTDNPHTHLIVRGRRANGQDLIIPKDFIRHGFRNIARDVATEWLGPRSPADERLALDREVGRHAPTRLDRMIEAHLPENRTIRIAQLRVPDGDPHTTGALKARARELERLGLATEVKRNVLRFEPDWRERLRAMELHLDVRKRIVQERLLLKQAELERSTKALSRGLLGR